MKNTKVLLACAGLVSLVSCTPGNETSSSQLTSASQIGSFKLDGSTALFRAADASDADGGTGSLSIGSGKMDRIFSILESGDFTKLKYVDLDGNEHEVSVGIQTSKVLSKKYVYIELPNGFQGIVSIKDGSIIRVEAMDIEVSSLAMYGSHVFAFSKDLKVLRRLNLDTEEIVSYITLGNNLKFISGGRFLASYTSMWWSDNGQSDDSRGKESMIVDADLNVLAQVEDTSVPNDTKYFYPIISPSGSSTRVDFKDVVGEHPLTLAYTGGKLYSVKSNSGPYVHGWSSSPLYGDVDITLSEVHLTQSGVVHSELQQIKPLVNFMAVGSGAFLCRTDYTLDSEKRYVPMGQGVLTVDFSRGQSSALSFEQSSFSFFDLLYRPDSKPSTTCYISEKYVYTLDIGNSKIYRRDLTAIESSSSELLVEMAGIKSFYVVGKHIFFTTDDGVYRMKKDGSGLKAMPGSFDINDVITVQ